MKKRDDIYLAQILQRIKSVSLHLKRVSQKKFFESELFKSAVIRELEVIGEAAKLVSPEIKEKYQNIPWSQMVGMRNRLIHEYFDVDDSIVWEVAKFQLPLLEKEFEKTLRETGTSIHPWRPCPSGYYYVRGHGRKITPTQSHPDGKITVREHCRRNPTGKDQLYPDEIFLISNSQQNKIDTSQVGKLNAPENANDFDALIAMWTQYWNEMFSSKDPLHANVVKALFFSESSFRVQVKDQRISKNNFARGPMQISDQTRKILADEQGQLRDHYLTLTAKDIKIPEVAIAAAIRWLFHKKDEATKYLKREATWDEVVAHYKGYLRRKNYRNQKGMKNYFETYDKLKKNKK